MSDEFEKEARLLLESDDLYLVRLHGRCVQRGKRPVLVFERLQTYDSRRYFCLFGVP